MGKGRQRMEARAAPPALAALALAAGVSCGPGGVVVPPPGWNGGGGTGGSAGAAGVSGGPSSGGSAGAFEPPGVVTHEGPLVTGDTWSRAWGGDGWCESQAVAFAPDGSIYVTGWFTKTTDFDPDAPIAPVTAAENSGMFLSRFDSAGNLLRTLTWVSHDQTSNDRWGNEGWALAVDADGSVYLGGQYSGTLDVDPGPPILEQTAVAIRFDAILLQVTSEGALAWYTAWNASDMGRVRSVSLTEAGIVIGGQLAGTVDVDPGPGVEERADVPPLEEGFGHLGDCALVALTEDGALEWVHTWGDRFLDENCVADADAQVAVSAGKSSTAASLDGFAGGRTIGPAGWLVEFGADGADRGATMFNAVPRTVSLVPGGGAVIGGEFAGDVDFGTVEQPDLRSTGDRTNAVLLRFDESGAPLWVRTWGGDAHAWSLAVEATSSEIVTSGRFEGTVDFDFFQATADEDRAFVRAFSLDGEPLWAHVVKGGGSFAPGVAVQDGVVAVAGGFYGTADFDFGQGSDIWSSPGLYGCWLARFPIPER